MSGTKLSLIRAQQQVPADENAQRGALLAAAEKTYIPFYGLTGGEFRLYLMQRELEAFKAYFPEYRALYERGENLIRAALSGRTVYYGALPAELQPVAAAIEDATTRKYSVIRFLEGATPRAAVKGGVIPTDYCDKYKKGHFDYTTGQWVEDYSAEYNDCLARMSSWEDILNAHLEKTSAHMLYNFIPANDEAQYTNKVQFKKLLHVQGVSAFAFATDFNRADIEEWMRLGVKLSAMENGLGITDALSVCQQMRDNPTDTPQINAPIPLVTILIIKVILAAIAAAVAIVQAIEQRKLAEIRAGQIKSFGSPEYSADPFDHKKTDPNGNPNPNPTPTPTTKDNSALIVGGAVLAGFLLLNNNKRK